MYSEPGIEPATLSVSGLKSGGPLLDKATIRCIMDGAKQPKVIEAGKEILLYREVIDYEGISTMLSKVHLTAPRRLFEQNIKKSL